MNHFPRPTILLHPQIPKPLHGLNPRSILGKQWWDMKRQESYATHNYRCWACGIHKRSARYHQWLEAHECYQFDYAKGTARMIEITALCHSCHNYIHDGRMLHELDAGKMTEEKYEQILSHGDDLLEGIWCTSNPYIIDDSDTADWEEWRLIIEGKEYRSRFKSHEEWQRFYQG